MNETEIREYQRQKRLTDQREKYFGAKMLGFSTADATEMKYWSWKRIKAEAERRANE